MSTKNTVPFGIKTEQDSDQNGKAQQGGSAVAEKGQGNADDGGQSDDHAHVHQEVHEHNACHPVAIDARERGALTFGEVQDS